MYNVQHKSFDRDKPEKRKRPIQVETAGYMRAQTRIENMINAGQRLVEYRKTQFDFDGENIDEDYYDPTRNKNLDMAEAFQMQEQAKRNLLESKRAKDMALKASQTALEASQEAQKGKTDPE